MLLFLSIRKGHLEELLLKLEKNFRRKNVATKLEGGRGKELVVGQLKIYFFCGFPKVFLNISIHSKYQDLKNYLISFLQYVH